MSHPRPRRIHILCFFVVLTSNRHSHISVHLSYSYLILAHNVVKPVVPRTCFSRAIVSSLLYAEGHQLSHLSRFLLDLSPLPHLIEDRDSNLFIVSLCYHKSPYLSSLPLHPPTILPAACQFYVFCHLLTSSMTRPLCDLTHRVNTRSRRSLRCIFPPSLKFS